jgi:hypothetical protein
MYSYPGSKFSTRTLLECTEQLISIYCSMPLSMPMGSTDRVSHLGTTRSSSTNSLTYPERYSRGGLQAGGDAGTWGSLGTTRVTARTAVAAPQRRSRRGRKPRIWQRKRLGVQKGGRQGKAWPCRISKPRTSRTALPSSKTRAGCRPPPPQPRDPHHPGSVRRLGKVQSAGWASRAKADLKIAAV